MVHHLLLSRTLLHRNQTILPQTFRRYKSLTAAIERGRQGRPDHSSRFSPRTADDSGRFGRRDFGGRFGGRDDGGRSRPRDDRFGDRTSRPSNDNGRPINNGYGDRMRPRESRVTREAREPSRLNNPSRTRAAPRSQVAWPSSGTDYDARPRFSRDGERPAFRSNSTRSNTGMNDKRPQTSERRTSRDDRPLDRPDRRDDQPSDRLNRQEGRPYNRNSRRDDRSGTNNHDDHVSSATPEANTTASTKPGRGPETLPYSTAASEFIYGYSSALAAIRANRRQFYTLYIHSRGAARDDLMTTIRELRLFPIMKNVGDEYLSAMDRASSGRPHNGVILEASPLPVPPITEIKSAKISDGSFQVSVDDQSAEDALVNGEQEMYRYKSAGWRFPLVLYVDGVLDEGNLGAIARSAYFLGVDAIATPSRQTAPWSHIALKASAGAAEDIPIFKVGNPADFLGKSSRAGWRIYASDSIPPTHSTSITLSNGGGLGRKVVYTVARSTKRLDPDHSPVAEHPTILMMGAEGQGLRNSLLNLAHYKVGIPHGREQTQVGVDSLNVSVAASILCYEMLQKPQPKPTLSTDETLF